MTASVTRASAEFRDLVQAAAKNVIQRAAASFGSFDALAAQFPFVDNYAYVHDCAVQNLDPESAVRRIQRATGLTDSAIELWLAVGLLEEDARFGPLFESVHEIHGQHRPTMSLLNAWWRDDADCHNVRADLRSLLNCGLVEPVNPDAPRLEWALQVPPVLWDVVRGEPLSADAFEYTPTARLPDFGDLALPESVTARKRQLQAILAGTDGAIVVRGPHHNGRGSLLGALAKDARRGVLQFRTGAKDDARIWRMAGPLATMLDALPVVRIEAVAGESVELAKLRGYNGRLGIVMGRFGVVHGPACQPLETVNLPMPSLAVRRRVWQMTAPDAPVFAAEHYRLTTGNIGRASRLARLYANADECQVLQESHVRAAVSSLNRQSLDALAMRLEPSGGWPRIAVDYETLQDLRNLESRCRHRERLPEVLGEAYQGSSNQAVRVLFKGPSGCGKTYAAGLLASVLGKDIYRVDLSSVVNKYIGETEKNLERLFALSEELDVILLLDEGDALLTQRTAVVSSNDRYANLETNFLLQRIEAFDGILIVTTNASERIDAAFQRRMDVVIGFQPPDSAERHAIWQLHLPVSHQVDAMFLSEVAGRCTLSGGQIRNAVLHASLLALEQGSGIQTRHLDAAVRREYRKAGGDCPLRR